MRAIAKKLAMQPLVFKTDYSLEEQPRGEKERTMNDVMVQAVLWVAAATTLVLYLKRRRKRKMLP